MKVLDFIYNKTTISFEPTGKDDVMVNATEMAKAFGKRIDVFLKADYINEFILALELPLNGGSSESKNSDELPLNGGSSDVLSRDEIIKTRNGVDTWMHRILALKFAAWLDPKFEVWVWRTIDTIILGYYREVKEATFEKLGAEKKRDEIKAELLRKYPEISDLLVAEGLITEAEKKRAKALRAATNQLKFEFEMNN